MSVAEVEQAFFALDPRDRTALIHRGLQTLDTEDTEVDQDEVETAWRSELRRRIDDVESGAVELLDAGEVHAQIRAELAAIRP